MAEQRRTAQLLVELETEVKRLMIENDALKRKGVELTIKNNKLKQSLDQTTKISKAQRQQITEANTRADEAEARLLASASGPPVTPDTKDTDTVNGLKQELSQSNKRLSDYRKRLSDVQERLAVIEQVTLVTQTREIQEDVNYYNFLLEEDEGDRLFLDSTQLKPHRAGSDVLRAMYSELMTMLDARIVAANMYQRNALTLKELQSIQSLKDRPVEAAETLLNIIMEQPDAVYLCFLDVLKHTGQHHIYQRLLEDGYRDYDDHSLHTSVIRQNYVFLLETLDVKCSDLLSRLFSTDVLSPVEKDDIAAEQTSFRANEKLLSALSRKSPQQFQLFLDALDDCGQQHVRNVITDRPVGQLIHVLPEGKPVRGVTVLEDMIYVLRDQATVQVEVYDVATYCLQRCLTVPNSRGFSDMTSCEHYLCAYISDHVVKCVHRLDVQNNFKMWPINDIPSCLSVNIVGNLLVTCSDVCKIKEFSASGNYLRDIPLPIGVVNPRHAVELPSGWFIVSHGSSHQNDPIHRVCMVSPDGHHIVQSHGGYRGSNTGQYNGPHHLAVNDNGFVFVVDVFNRRVTLLSDMLNYIRQVVTRKELKRWPGRLCLDVKGHRLYVTDNDVRGGKNTSGRVVVINVLT